MWVTLEENRSTGYKWGVFYSNGPSVTEDHFVPRPSLLPNGDRLAGAGGHRVMRLSGPGHIVFYLRQPWNDTSIADIQLYRVKGT